MAVTTPKSPQPGHQIGLRSLLKSPAWNSSAGMGSDGVSWIDSLMVRRSVRHRLGLMLIAVALEGDDHFAQPFQHFARAEWGWSRSWPTV